MGCRVDVIVAVRHARSFRQLLKTVDAQSIDAHAVRVVAALDDDLPADDVALLKSLSGYRPNLELVDASSDGDLSPALQQAASPWVLPLLDTERLFPQALSALLAVGGASGSAVVVGRRVTAGPSSTDWLVLRHHDGDVLDRDDVRDPEDWPVLVGRAALEPSARPVDVGSLRRRAVRSAERLLAATSVAVARTSLSASAATGEPPVSERVSLAWEHGRLRVTSSATDVAYVGLRSAESGLEWILPAVASGTSWLAEIDLATVAGGASLDAGRWIPFACQGPVERPSRVVLTTSSQLRPVFADGRLVLVASRHDGVVVIDVGATHRSPFRGVTPDDAIVEESARGTRLTLVIPGAVAYDDGRIPATLRIGTFTVPASLVAASGSLALEASLAAIEGCFPLSVCLPGSPWYDTKLDLDVAHTGEMRVVARRRPARQKSRPQPTRPPSLVRRLVRRIPGAVAVYRRIR